MGFLLNFYLESAFFATPSRPNARNRNRIMCQGCTTYGLFRTETRAKLPRRSVDRGAQACVQQFNVQTHAALRKQNKCKHVEYFPIFMSVCVRLFVNHLAEK